MILKYLQNTINYVEFTYMKKIGEAEKKSMKTIHGENNATSATQPGHLFHKTK